MKKYNVNIPIFATAIVTVEANSVEEAMEIAAEECPRSVCYQCSAKVDLDGGIDEDKFTKDCVSEA
jgi:hypothetical protein